MKKIFIILCLLGLLIGCSSGSTQIINYQYNNETINLDGELFYSVEDEYNLSFVINPTSNFDDDVLLRIGNYTLCYGDLSLDTGKENYVVINVKNKKINVNVNGEEKHSDNLDSSVNEIVFSDYGNEGYVKGLTVGNKVKSEELIQEEYSNVYVDMLLSDIKFNDMDDVREDFWLYPMLNDEYPITWVSSNEDVIKPEFNHGVVTIPSVDTQVILTAKVNDNDKEYTRDFVFSVLADNETTRLKRDSEALVNDMGYFVNNALELPNEGYNDSQIMWSVVSGDISIEDNVIIKNDSADEKELIQLQATLVNGNSSNTIEFNLCLLDEYKGYILAYFNGELEEERGKLAYSYDGLHWENIAQGNTILSSELGNGRIRDPFISRDKNGNFVVVATQGFDNPSIYVWKSNDLITFENSLVDITVEDEKLNLTGERAWAPEFIYVPSLDEYYVYYSDPMGEESGSIYYASTKDFETFSYPKEILNVGYPIIDGTILNLDGKNWMFYKDERVGATTVFYGETRFLEQGFGKVYDQRFICPIKQVEGPFVFKDFNTGDNYLYVDYYSKHKFYVARFTELGYNADFEWLEESEYSLPENVRHGSVIPVTEKELTNTLEYYN